MATRKAAAKTDPFADDDPPFEPDPPADEAQTVSGRSPRASGSSDPSDTNNKENTVVADQINEVSVTLKGGTGFDAPWVVVRASSPEEALTLLSDDQVIKDLLDKAADRGAYFASKAPAKPAASGGGGRAANPAAAAQEHPEGKEEFCEHGKMKYKAGISGPNAKTPNTPYKMFVCDGNVPRNEQCRPKNA